MYRYFYTSIKCIVEQIIITWINLPRWLKCVAVRSHHKQTQTCSIVGCFRNLGKFFKMFICSFRNRCIFSFFVSIWKYCAPLIFFNIIYLLVASIFINFLRSFESDGNAQKQQVGTDFIST